MKMEPSGSVCRTWGILLIVPAVIALYPKIFFRLRLTTAYEYLEKRFDYRVRAFAALFFMAARVM